VTCGTISHFCAPLVRSIRVFHTGYNSIRKRKETMHSGIFEVKQAFLTPQSLSAHDVHMQVVKSD
jgi:hypothetical protein